MLGKLLKFELKASARTLLPLYAGTLLVAMVCGISNATRMSNMNKWHQAMADGTAITFSSFSEPVDGGINTVIMFAMMLVFAFCVALVVMTVMCVIGRFNDGIAGKEGYLMFTLPVKQETLLASKLLGALVWTLASMLVIFLVGVIIGGATVWVEREFFDWPYLWERIWTWIQEYSLGFPLLLTAMNGLLSIISVILTIYLAIMVGQMEQFNKYRVAVAVVAFFVITWAFCLAETILMGLPGINMRPEHVADVYGNYNMIAGMDCLCTAIFCIACFYGTVWMMKKKLNL
jgi:hypothetical protein